MIELLLYISLISGGLLILSLILSLFAGLDLDLDIDVDGNGGLGIFKGGLTFLSIGAYVVRAILLTSDNPILAYTMGVLAGGVAVFILYMFLKWLLSNQEEVNYRNEDAVYKTATVYLKIPKTGTGIIHVKINGVLRELKASSGDKKEIPTGTEVLVSEVNNEIAIVTTKLN